MLTYWGRSQTVDKILPGVYYVTTASHGGLMIGAKIAQSLISPLAISYGAKMGSWLCYEEDCLWAIPAYEHSLIAEYCNFNGLAPLPSQEYHEQVRQVIQHWYPEYLIEEQMRQVLNCNGRYKRRGHEEAAR